MNSKWITDLNVKRKIIKLVKEPRENVRSLGFSEEFVDTTAKSMVKLKFNFIKKEKLISRTSLKLKSFAL